MLPRKAATIAYSERLSVLLPTLAGIIGHVAYFIVIHTLRGSNKFFHMS
jgi:hypothetical protein